MCICVYLVFTIVSRRTLHTGRTLDRERVETIRLVLRVEDLAAMSSRQTATGTYPPKSTVTSSHTWHTWVPI